MADRSNIEWTDASWTPIRARHKATGKIGWHCTHATPGCVHCYAEGLNKRLGTGLPFKPGHAGEIELFLDEEMLLAPLRWRKPRMIFVCSMTDLFADFVPDEWIDRIFAVMALTPQHTYQVLTKRSARMRAYVGALAGTYPDGWPKNEAHYRVWQQMGRVDQLGLGCKPPAWPLPNAWLGVSAEDQRRADERIPDLLATPAAIRFVSAEPLLGPIDLTRLDLLRYFKVPNPDDPNWPRNTFDALRGRSDIHPIHHAEPDWCKLDWIIVGGESGRGARPMHPDWARQIRDQCAAAGTAFFFKQMAKREPIPADLMIRRFPESASVGFEGNSGA